MTYLKVLLVFIEVVCSLLLIGVILLQRSKGEGLGLAFGAEMGESLFGARATNVLVKATVWLGVIFLLNTAMLARIYSRGQTASLMSGARVPAPAQSTVPAPMTPETPAMPAPMTPASAPMAPAPAQPALPVPMAPVSVPAEPAPAMPAP